MFRVFITLLLVSVPVVALAQVRDGGVIESTDEFTGVRTCWQQVDSSIQDGAGVWMMLDEDGWTVFTYIVRDIDAQRNVAFSLLGLIGDERVYVRFGEGDVLELHPSFVERDSSREVAGFTDNSLAARIMSAPEDIRVRFEGSSGRVDFTIDHGVPVALAAGFGQACYPH